MNMATALLSIQALLTAAEPDDPQVFSNSIFDKQDGVVAAQYLYNHNEYEKQAREWVKLYAQKDMMTEKELMV